MFSDVPAEDWYTQPLKRLADLGIVVGDPQGTFRPEDPVKRDENVVMLDRLLTEIVRRELTRDYQFRMYQRVAASTFTVKATFGDSRNNAMDWGAGFIYKDNTIITARHVVHHDKPQFTVVWHGDCKTELPARLVDEAGVADVARLEITAPGYTWQYLPVDRETRVRRGQPLFLMGSGTFRHAVPCWDAYALEASMFTDDLGSKQPDFCVASWSFQGASGGPAILIGDDLVPRVVGACAFTTADNPHPQNCAGYSPAYAWPDFWFTGVPANG